MGCAREARFHTGFGMGQDRSGVFFSCIQLPLRAMIMIGGEIFGSVGIATSLQRGVSERSNPRNVRRCLRWTSYTNGHPAFRGPQRAAPERRAHTHGRKV